MSSPIQRFWGALALAIAAMLPALWVRFGHYGLSPTLTVVLAGIAILAAGFMLSWGVEAAEEHVPRGLALAILALITVLPEFVVDFYYAIRGGQNPASDYVHYATANMTGANRLLVGFGWPVIVLLYWWRTRRRAVQLDVDNSIEIFFLLVTTLYSFLLSSKHRIDLLDGIVLFVLYGTYLWRLSWQPRDEDDEEGEGEREVGPAAALESLPRVRKFALMAALAVVAAAVIVLEAEPFAESLVGTASALGVNHFFLIQWVSPLAGELPEMVIAVLFTLSLRPGHALGALVSDKINQWTLLLGALPMVFAYGAGYFTSLPLAPRQSEELFLTAAQSLFAVMLLVRLRFTLASALVLLTLFLGQVGIAFVTQADEARTIRDLTIFAWVYIGLALGLAVFSYRQLVRVIKVGVGYDVPGSNAPVQT